MCAKDSLVICVRAAHRCEVMALFHFFALWYFSLFVYDDIVLSAEFPSKSHGGHSNLVVAQKFVCYYKVISIRIV